MFSCKLIFIVVPHSVTHGETQCLLVAIGFLQQVQSLSPEPPGALSNLELCQTGPWAREGSLPLQSPGWTSS